MKSDEFNGRTDRGNGRLFLKVSEWLTVLLANYGNLDLCVVWVVPHMVLCSIVYEMQKSADYFTS
jgi:hypothetical protein